MELTEKCTSVTWLSKVETILRTTLYYVIVFHPHRNLQQPAGKTTTETLNPFVMISWAHEL